MPTLRGSGVEQYGRTRVQTFSHATSIVNNGARGGWENSKTRKEGMRRMQRSQTTCQDAVQAAGPVRVKILYLSCRAHSTVVPTGQELTFCSLQAKLGGLWTGERVKTMTPGRPELGSTYLQRVCISFLYPKTAFRPSKHKAEPPNEFVFTPGAALQTPQHSLPK